MSEPIQSLNVMFVYRWIRRGISLDIQRDTHRAFAMMARMYASRPILFFSVWDFDN